jgi:hypothetical protein
MKPMMKVLLIFVVVGVVSAGKGHPAFPQSGRDDDDRDVKPITETKDEWSFDSTSRNASSQTKIRFSIDVKSDVVRLKSRPLVITTLNKFNSQGVFSHKRY